MGNLMAIKCVQSTQSSQNIESSGVKKAENTPSTSPVFEMKSAGVNEQLPKDRVGQALKDLVNVIMEGEQDAFLSAWSNYLYAVKMAYDKRGDMKDEDLSALARKLYYQSTGKDIVDDIRKNSHWNFTQGFIKGVTMGLFGQSRSADDNIYFVTGIDKPSNSRPARKVGGVLGGASSGAVIGGGIGSIVPGVGTALGAGAGAVIGGIVGLFQ